MGRQTSRLVADSAWLEHGLTQRTFAGSVTMSQVTTTSVTGGATTTTGSTTVPFSQPAAWTSASLTVAAANLGGNNTPVNLTISINGSAVASTTHSNTTMAASTSISQNSHATPQNPGRWTFNWSFATTGTTIDSITASRDSRWTTLSPANP